MNNKFYFLKKIQLFEKENHVVYLIFTFIIKPLQGDISIVCKLTKCIRECMIVAML